MIGLKQNRLKTNAWYDATAVCPVSDGRGGTEVSVKITCDEERRWFEIGA